jgi:hypothetical protein
MTEPQQSAARFCMRPTLPTFAIIGLVLSLLSAPQCLASFPIGNSETNVTVSFEFPDGTTNAITLTYNSALDAFRKRPLPREVSPTVYKIDFWIYAALQSLDLHFETKTVRGQAMIVRISQTASGPDGEWIYYVNGIRSPYHINTQLDDAVKKIRFTFKKKRSNERSGVEPGWPLLFTCEGHWPGATHRGC